MGRGVKAGPGPFMIEANAAKIGRRMNYGGKNAHEIDRPISSHNSKPFAKVPITRRGFRRFVWLTKKCGWSGTQPEPISTGSGEKRAFEPALGGDSAAMWRRVRIMKGNDPVPESSI